MFLQNPRRIKNPAQKKTSLYKGSYALVIGVHNYNNGWNKLPGVKTDVDLVSAALEDNGFFVYKVLDPDKREFEEAFENFIKLHGDNYDNRLIFYFAGHGHTITPKYGGSPLGYILPKEAPIPTNNEAEFKSIAMSMQRVEEYALKIDAKRTKYFMYDTMF